MIFFSFRQIFNAASTVLRTWNDAFVWNNLMTNFRHDSNSNVKSQKELQLKQQFVLYCFETLIKLSSFKACKIWKRIQFVSLIMRQKEFFMTVRRSMSVFDRVFFFFLNFSNCFIFFGFRVWNVDVINVHNLTELTVFKTTSRIVFFCFFASFKMQSNKFINTICTFRDSFRSLHENSNTRKILSLNDYIYVFDIHIKIHDIGET